VTNYHDKSAHPDEDEGVESIQIKPTAHLWFVCHQPGDDLAWASKLDPTGLRRLAALAGTSPDELDQLPSTVSISRPCVVSAQTSLSEWKLASCGIQDIEARRAPLSILPSSRQLKDTGPIGHFHAHQSSQHRAKRGQVAALHWPRFR
jgi:hypothetical protein